MSGPYQNLPTPQALFSKKSRKSFPVVSARHLSLETELSRPSIEQITTPAFRTVGRELFIDDPAVRYLPREAVRFFIETTIHAPDRVLYVDKGLTGNGNTYGNLDLFVHGDLADLGIRHFMVVLPNREVAIDKYRQFHDLLSLENLPIRMEHRIGAGSSRLPARRPWLPKDAPVLTIAVMDGIDEADLSGVEAPDFILFDETHKNDSDATFRKTTIAGTSHKLRASGIPTLHITATPTREPDLTVRMASWMFSNARRIEYLTHTNKGKSFGSFVPVKLIDRLVEEQREAPAGRVILALALSTASVAALWNHFRGRGLKVGLVVGAKVETKLLNLFPPSESPLVLREPDLNRADVVIVTKAGTEGYDLDKEGLVLVTNPAPLSHLALTNQELVQLLGRTRRGVRVLAVPSHGGQSKLAPEGEGLELCKTFGLYSDRGGWVETRIDGFKREFTYEARRIQQAILGGELAESLSLQGRDHTLMALGTRVPVKELFTLVDGDYVLFENPVFNALARYETDPVGLARDIVPALDADGLFTTDSGAMLRVEGAGTYEAERDYIEDVLLLLADGEHFSISDSGKLSGEYTPGFIDPLKERFRTIFLQLFHDQGIQTSLIETFAPADTWVPENDKMPIGKKFKKGQGNPWYDYKKDCPKRIADKAIYPRLKAILEGLAVFLRENGLGERNYATEALESLETFDERHEAILEALSDKARFKGILDHINAKLKKTRNERDRATDKRTREERQKDVDTLKRRKALIASPEWFVAPLLGSMLGLTRLHSKTVDYREYNLATTLGSRYLETILPVFGVEAIEMDLPQIAVNFLVAMAGGSRDARSGDLYSVATERIMAKNPGMTRADARSSAKEQVNTILNTLYPKNMPNNKKQRERVGRDTTAHINRSLGTLESLGIITAKQKAPLADLLRRIGNRSSFFYLYTYAEKRIVSHIRKEVMMPLSGFAGFRLHDGLYVSKRLMRSRNYGVEPVRQHAIRQLDLVVRSDAGEGRISSLMPYTAADGYAEMDEANRAVLRCDIKTPGFFILAVSGWFSEENVAVNELEQTIEAAVTAFSGSQTVSVGGHMIQGWFAGPRLEVPDPVQQYLRLYEQSEKSSARKY